MTYLENFAASEHHAGGGVCEGTMARIEGPTQPGLCKRWGIKIICTLSASLVALGTAMAEPRWQALPDTPELPAGGHEGEAPINGVKIWYAVYGSGDPVIMLHGGLGNSNYWGNQIPALAGSYQVIVMDSRGHGRSTRDGQPYSYDLMASDVVALMDFLKLPKAAIIGWSDGAIIGLKLAIDKPARVRKLFAFAPNSKPSGLADLSKSKTFKEYELRTEREYGKLSATPDGYKDFYAELNKMWTSQPDLTAEALGSIRVPVWVVDGDHDDVVTREDTLFIANHIPWSGLLIQPEVGHFSLIQDPDRFSDDILHFLQRD